MEEVRQLLTRLRECLKEATQIVAQLQHLIPQAEKPATQRRDEPLIVTEQPGVEAESPPPETEEKKPDRKALLEPIAELAAKTPGLFTQKEAKQLLQAAQKEWEESEQDRLTYAKVVWVCAAVRCRLAMSTTPQLLRLEELLQEACTGLGDYRIIWRREEVPKQVFAPISVYDDSPEGTPVAVVEPAVMRGEDILKTGRMAVSVGREHAVSAAAVAAIKALSSTAAPNENALRDLYTSLRQLHSWWLGMPEKLKPEHEQARLRDILNTLDLFSWRHKAESPALKNCADSIIKTLKEMGFKEIYVPIGRKFDESLSPSKFEREFVRSDAPPGTIVGVIRRGFVDASGTAVQKVLVAVSR